MLALYVFAMGDRTSEGADSSAYPPYDLHLVDIYSPFWYKTRQTLNFNEDQQQFQCSDSLLRSLYWDNLQFYGFISQRR